MKLNNILRIQKTKSEVKHGKILRDFLEGLDQMSLYVSVGKGKQKKLLPVTSFNVESGLISINTDNEGK